MIGEKVLKGSMLAAAATLAATSAQAEPTSSANDEKATSQQETTPKAEIVKRGPDGKAEIVRIEGREYPVCKGEAVDGCINPRDAGLNWGDKEIDYWPGKPASQIEEPLPVNRD